ncbi:hypothetical protein [Sinomonas atrocyanea]|uniref:hypothetical protein n=1 Tax=Sinomonas atrocyanea TaxID=37927 RepID=UPI0027892C3D|nr:hypothetical protein [Sinomonas atrocyanea]MDQ0259539.1 hypothetical protein [Sinomonas atrocyanea]MDR6623202.1 hypothetical protein [Sinomonas atrocyanea]
MTAPGEMAVPRPPGPRTFVYSVGADAEDAKNSRCCRPADPPYLWHSYYVPDNEGIAAVRDWFDQLPIVVSETLIGELEAIFETAAAGCTNPSDRDKPIKAFRRGEQYYELRHTLDPLIEGVPRQLFRHYHYEPDGEWSTYLVALHAHFKDVAGDAKQVSDEQTRQMVYAKKRCELGRSQHWNLPCEVENLVDRLLDLDT